ncbi:MAG: GntR family transcriptional regulator [Phycisphaerae bacterium]
MRARKSDSVFSPDERFQLDASSPVPLYHQMTQILLERISRPEMVGRMVPPEFDLIEMFGVSRATVKKTLDDLVAKGLLERRRGVGTRVIQNKIVEDLARLKGYTEEMASKGLRIRTEVLGVDEHVPTDEVRARLQLPARAKTVRIRRLRGTNKVFPVVLLCSEIPASYGIRANEDFRHSLYELIERKHRIPIVWGEETIEAATATAEQAGHLKLKAGDTVLIMERVTYTHGNRPVEFVKAVYRPDRYKFSIRLSR